MRWRIAALIILQSALNAFAQDILLDNSTYDFYGYLDTLQTRGVSIHLLEVEGWADLDSMDAFWIVDLWDSYTTDEKQMIQRFCRNGGNIVIWHTTPSNMFVNNTNDLLTDDGWQTTLRLETADTASTHYAGCIEHFAPFTNNIDSLRFEGYSLIEYGENAFPIVYMESTCTTPVVVVSYPYIVDNICSYLLLITGAYGLLNINCLGHFFVDNPKFVENTMLAASNVSGYELSPCSTPQSHACSRAPNPFTPNFDGTNDYVQISFEGLGEITATVSIYDLHSHLVKTLAVPTGEKAKSAARWDGTDQSGNAVMQGLYMYVVESGGKVVCEGTVTIAR
jgi:gliding motility-associated-like protein